MKLNRFNRSLLESSDWRRYNKSLLKTSEYLELQVLITTINNERSEVHLSDIGLFLSRINLKDSHLVVHYPTE